ncbi:hypothetical protein B0T25DRAFT_529737 [Lasiosphaeria hispida]|uniref:Secreted protein n=1 Tax=Lasiosphaeria hispida TaxID=260671 RepID=A0AAJ0HWU9_9PEZI|nr:hypothetical protein B0T25DRAFT_529737 [Lasiosphaeria hispida]
MVIFCFHCFFSSFASSSARNMTSSHATPAEKSNRALPVLHEFCHPMPLRIPCSIACRSRFALAFWTNLVGGQVGSGRSARSVFPMNEASEFE